MQLFFSSLYNYLYHISINTLTIHSGLIINFCDKTEMFNFKIVLFKIVLFSESIYFHLCNKKYREPWEKSQLMNFAQNEL